MPPFWRWVASEASVTAFVRPPSAACGGGWPYKRPAASSVGFAEIRKADKSRAGSTQTSSVQLPSRQLPQAPAAGTGLAPTRLRLGVHTPVPNVNLHQRTQIALYIKINCIPLKKVKKHYIIKVSF